MDALTVRDTIIAALMPLDVDLTDGEPATARDGTVRRTLIVTVDQGVTGGRRMSGRAPDVRRLIGVLVVTSSRDSCLHLAERVRDTLDGQYARPHGLITDESYSGDPIPEPSTHPARWSKALAFAWTTKRST